MKKIFDNNIKLDGRKNRKFCVYMNYKYNKLFKKLLRNNNKGITLSLI
jgi:hypothetical protein